MFARISAGASSSVLGLDILRGLAAILVVLGHSRSMLSDAMGASLTDAVWQKVVLLPTSFAQESVAVFFVLSGYLVGGQVVREVSAGRFSWRLYLAKRLSRLWTVLIPGLVLTLLVGIIGGYAGQTWGRVAARGSLDPLTALCNVTFLQEPRCGTYGSNDSLWSLAFEFWFYLIFSAGTVAVFALVRGLWVRAAIGLAMVTGCIFIFGTSLLVLIPSWLMGVVLAAVHARWKNDGVPSWMERRSKVAVFVLIAVVVAGMLASNFLNPYREVRFLLVGACVAPLVLYLATGSELVRDRFVRKLAKTGEISFSLYVYHLPIVKLLVVGVVASGSPSPVLAAALVFLVAAVAYVLCLPLWAATERNTHHVRIALRRLFRVPETSPRQSTVLTRTS